ncbi:type II toxin-antitoxin system RelE/ParE family toxin [Candidatus Formimonas warabiya]|uniref:Plasmid stabilization protein n=1 Tax=Formimonas warabiya TaxID=1761012 RepID=A0A3G1KYV2_FORW1|nr:type II toxin-antitoxin system RelE/ParE family toxin [Candidatus Formimonas warabiya]ATW27641.1 plasmid stabilization protein [Candidatus Formimonas warabiya]
MYRITFLPPAEKYFKKIKDQNLKRKFEVAIKELRNDPFIGEAKSGDLAGIYGYDVYYGKTNYEIAYRIVEDENGDIMVVIMAGSRENFWTTIKKYIR